ncbi:hypothetical protein TNCV_3984091 [Trichonephila clavipes]|nr:hypothetical protein TNCV_3984091 [Trichonephila clavipes]
MVESKFILDFKCYSKSVQLKIQRHHLGTIPWDFGRKPGSSFIPRKYQTAFLRFVSGPIKPLRQGQKIFPECYSELISPAHIWTCFDLKKKGPSGPSYVFRLPGFMEIARQSGIRNNNN